MKILILFFIGLSFRAFCEESSKDSSSSANVNTPAGDKMHENLLKDINDAQSKYNEARQALYEYYQLKGWNQNHRVSTGGINMHDVYKNGNYYTIGLPNTNPYQMYQKHLLNPIGSMNFGGLGSYFKNCGSLDQHCVINEDKDLITCVFDDGSRKEFKLSADTSTSGADPKEAVGDRNDSPGDRGVDVKSFENKLRSSGEYKF